MFDGENLAAWLFFLVWGRGACKVCCQTLVDCLKRNIKANKLSLIVRCKLCRVITLQTSLRNFAVNFGRKTSPTKFRRLSGSDK